MFIYTFNFHRTVLLIILQVYIYILPLLYQLLYLHPFPLYLKLPWPQRRKKRSRLTSPLYLRLPWVVQIQLDDLLLWMSGPLYWTLLVHTQSPLLIILMMSTTTHPPLGLPTHPLTQLRSSIFFVKSIFETIPFLNDTMSYELKRMLLHLTEFRQELMVAASNCQADVPHLRKYLLHMITATIKLLSGHLQDHHPLPAKSLNHLEEDEITAEFSTDTEDYTNVLLSNLISSSPPHIFFFWTGFLKMIQWFGRKGVVVLKKKMCGGDEDIKFESNTFV